MITLKNTQRKISLDLKKLHGDIQTILNLVKYPDFDIGIWFTTNKTIRHYNYKYRHKNNSTDILSFAYNQELQAGKRIHAKNPEDRNLGDLILSPEYIKRETEKLNIPFNQRMRILLVHGICHLLGYDHDTDKDYRRMRAKEAWIIKHLH